MRNSGRLAPLIWRWWGCGLVLMASLGYFALTMRLPTLPETIRGDGLGYHVWTRGMLAGDLTLCAWRDMVPGHVLPLGDLGGVCPAKYPPGVALIRLPIMAAFAWPARDAMGVSTIEHRTVLAISLTLLVLIACLATGACRQLGLSPGSSSAAVGAFVFGTGLLMYGTFWASYSHIYAAFACALLLWALARGWASGEGPPWLPAALGACLMVLVRSVDAMAVAWLSAAYFAGRVRKVSVRDAALELLPVAVGGALGVATILGYNRWAIGRLALSSYGQEWFHPSLAGIGAVAFALDRGLVPTFPVAALTVVVGLAVRQARQPALWFAGLLGSFIVLYGCWDMPGLGYSFGPRGLVDLMPAGIIVLAAAWTGLARPWRRLLAIAVLVCATVTVELALGQIGTRLPEQDITPEVYWANVVGKASLRYYLGPRRAGPRPVQPVAPLEHPEGERR